MNIPGLRFLLLLLVINPATSFAQEARLSYELLPGRIYLLDIEMQQNTSSETMNSEDINMYSSVLLEFRLDSISTENLIHMSVRYKKLHLSMLAPGLGIDINSETGNNQLLTDLVDTLQGYWFRLSMLESGELISLEGLSEIFQKLDTYPAEDRQEAELTMGSLLEAYGPDAFRSLFNLFVDIYPKVQPIMNWTKDLTYYFNTKPVEIANRYYYTKTSGEVHTIQAMGMINALKKYLETLPMGEVSSTVSGTQTYDFQTDVASGWLIRCISKQRLIIETTIVKSTRLPVGLKIPSYTETAYEVKGTIQ